ncbi:hypothetical protein ACO0QE_003023 [Hanseniaspora vineae]
MSILAVSNSNKSCYMKKAAQLLASNNKHQFQVISMRTKASKSDFEVPGRMSKPIRPGHARPAFYYKFDVLVQLSDGSVIKRKSQYPKSEFKSLQDQRNTPLWNPARKDLVVLDVGSGKVDRFKERYSTKSSTDEPAAVSSIKTDSATAAGAKDKSDSAVKSKEQKPVEEAEQEDEAEGFDMSDVDDYLDLLGTTESTGEVQKGGKVAVKKKGDDKKKRK